jgi:hypothetical protein
MSRNSVKNIDTSYEMRLNLKFVKPKRLMGLKVHHDGYKPTNSLEWWSAIAFMR